ncbi:MAG: WGR domain-containing protein [Microscillaceae bacterium]|jgi:predicted DNA-binding WGR domain protein|nr:WGR domain-containing protein [Microscillaceae bacterium]
MKALDKTAVLIAAEDLMSKFGSTTTLDVKNRLRNNGYMAAQAEVSQWMDVLAREENWAFSQKNNFRVYRPGPDTNDTLNHYLEKDNDFWEIKITGKAQVVSEGKKGTGGAFFHKNFTSNRQAIRHAKNLLAEKQQLGFAEVKDTRLPLEIREKFGKYLHQKPIQCTLGFFNVECIEEQAAEINTNQGLINGSILKVKNGGYRFTFVENLVAVAEVFRADEIDFLSLKIEQLKTTGEKVTTQAKNQANDEVSDYEVVKLVGEQSLTRLQAPKNNLYEAEFVFENGEKTTLSKFDLTFEQEFLPITQQILQN